MTVNSGSFYREYRISENKADVMLGTIDRCELKIPNSGAKDPISVQLSAKGTSFHIRCSDGCRLANGKTDASFSIREKAMLFDIDKGTNLMSVSVDIDFAKERAPFDKGIQLPNTAPVTIGGAENCTIRLRDTALASDIVTLRRDGTKYYLNPVSATYGVYVNGELINENCVVENNAFISISGYEFYTRHGYLYVDSIERVSIPADWDVIDSAYSRSHLDYPKFNKSVRFIEEPPKDPIEILDPPAKAEPKKANILLQLLPAVAMLALVIIVRGVLGNGSGSTFVIFSACSMTIGILTSIASIINDKKEIKQTNRNRNDKYLEYIERKRQEISDARAQEQILLKAIYRDIEQSIDAVKVFSPQLFDRSKSDPDFLRVYLGVGDQPAVRPVKINRHETIEVLDDLMQLPGQVAEETRYVHNAPVWADFAKNGVIGITGGDQKLYGMMRNMTIDICTRHFNNDISLYYVINTDFAEHVNWLRWLPHVQNKPLGVRNIVCSNESKTTLFEYLYSLISERENSKWQQHIIVFVFNDTDIKTHPLSRFMPNAAALGVTFLFFSRYAEYIPDCCGEVIKLDEDTLSGTIVSKPENRPLRFQYKEIDDDIAMQVSIRLAPIYCEDVSVESGLPDSYSFFDCYDIWAAGDLKIADTWGRADIAKTLAAPIGINARQEIEYLDIHERAHGPHGLVAGTTGSGKSELLLSYILSMCVNYPPDLVAFLIIDFKGGGTAYQLAELPHLVGAITDIDGRAITRSLKSIKAELNKRKVLFAESDVSKIDDYIAKYKQGAVKTPLPHLIIVVDEFAELKAEQPEFMKELISAARIGRSLGIHLILATQKPAGQVSDQIWSNSRFRMCLKVQSKEDSNEMLKSPLAAEIVQPGRAYLQVGNNEVFELFQSGYSGGPAGHDEATKKEKIRLSEISLWGKRKIVYESDNEETANVPTQLEAVIDALNTCCKENNIQRLQGICLPPLPETLDFPQSLPSEGNDIIVNLGIFDDPDHQLQEHVTMNLTNGNLMVIGSSQSGKTNLLQLILRNLAEQYSPEQVNVYILDFGSMILRNFDGLNHVGGVVCASEDEKLKNFFKLIHAEMAMRKQRISDAKISSFAAYVEAGYCDIPQIVILIDNFAALRELYLGEEDQLLPICREGLSVGISVVMVNAQTTGIGYKYFSNFSNRVALFCNDASEYSSVFDHCRTTVANIPGRGLIEMEHEIYEFQSYLSFKGKKEIDRVGAIEQLIATSNAKWPEHWAKRIPEIPQTLPEHMLSDDFGAVDVPYSIPMALDYASLDVMYLDLCKQGMIALFAEQTQNWVDFVRLILGYLHRNMFRYPTDVFLVDNQRRGLRSFSEMGVVTQYTTDPDDLEDIVARISEICADRFSNDVEAGSEDFDKDALQLVIVNNNEAVAALSKSVEGLKQFKSLLEKYRNMKLCFIFAGIEDTAAKIGLSEIVKLLKDRREALYFGELKKLKFYDVPAMFARQNKKPIGSGDAFYFHNDEIYRVKTAASEVLEIQ